MNETDIAKVRGLFNDAGIREGVDKFCIYIHAVVAQFIYADRDSGSSFATYRDAWLSPRASAYKKYLADIPETQWRALFGICECVQDSDGIDFISALSPELFPGDLNVLFNYLGRANPRRPFIYNLIKLYALYRYRNYLYGIEYLPHHRRLSDNEVLLLVEKLFDGWNEAGKYGALYKFRENLKDLWLLAFGTPFSPEKVSSVGIAGIRKELTELGFSDDDALELFYICKTSHLFDLKHIDDPFSYFRKISLDRVDTEMRVKEDGFGKEISSPGESFYLKEEMFYKILSKWKGIDTVDFVRSICFAAYSKNICAENALAIPYLQKNRGKEKHAIIFDANPDFIQSISEAESNFADSVLFVQSSRRLAMLYKQRFPRINFAFMQVEGDGVLTIVQVDVEAHYAGKELRFISQAVSELFSMAIVFVRRESETLLGKISSVLAGKLDSMNSPVFLFCPNSLLDTGDRSIRTVLAERYDYRWIQILPNATSSAWLKKNIIVCLTKKRNGTPEPLSLLHADIYDNPFGGSELICQDPWPVKILLSQFINSKKTINQLWEQFRAKPSRGKPRITREWRFSEEISLWYSWSNKRGRVHYHSVPTEKQLAVNPLQRGKRITPYYTYVLPYLNDLPLKDCGRANFDRCLELLPVTKEEEGLTYNLEVERHIKWIIKKVLEAAEKNEICPDILWGTDYSFPVEVTEETLNANELVKLRKSFRISEEVDISRLILEDPEQSGEKFGLALMFGLGLRNNEACGIKFGDIQPFRCDGSRYFMRVYSSTAIDSNEERFGGKTSNMARFIPIPGVLLSLLFRRRELLNRLISEGQLTLSDNPADGVLDDQELEAFVDGLPIVCRGESYTTPCSARVLTQAAKQLLKSVKVEQQILSLIDREFRRPGRTEDGIKEKEPTAYLFRRNLGTHLYLLGLTDSEIQYIMGHDIEDDNEERSFFRNEEKLYPIALKMEKRPIVNDIADGATKEMADNWLSERDICQDVVRIPISERLKKVVVTVEQREPLSGLTLKVEGPVDGTYEEFAYEAPFEETMSITRLYHDQYGRRIARVEALRRSESDGEK